MKSYNNEDKVAVVKELGVLTQMVHQFTNKDFIVKTSSNFQVMSHFGFQLTCSSVQTWRIIRLCQENFLKVEEQIKIGQQRNDIYQKGYKASTEEREVSSRTA